MREMEDRSRRNNLRFDGIDEANQETWHNTAIVRESFTNKNVRIERAHRMFRKGKNNSKLRSIIIKLLDYKDKKIILDNAKKTQKVQEFIFMKIFLQKQWQLGTIYGPK